MFVFVFTLVLSLHVAGLLSVTINNPNYLRSDSSLKFRWGNISMIEVTADLKFNIVNATQFEFYIPNSWSIDSALTSTENKLYKIYFFPFNPMIQNSNELVITFKYEIYVAPPENSSPYDFKSRVIVNSQEVREMPDEMKTVADELFSNAETYYEAIYRATDFTSDYLNYDINYVMKEMSVSEIWEKRAGVCRHYAMFEKALLNYAGIKAMYSTGFLIYEQNGKKNVIPHAWLMVYDPVNGWFPIDPTNHNFNHVNNFATGVIYPFDLLVRASTVYNPVVDYPVRGQITVNNVKSTFEIKSIRPIKHLKVYEYRLSNGFSFLYVEGAGLLIYHPLRQIFTDNSMIQQYGLLSFYEDSIVEYVPSGYLVPIGFEPYQSRAFLHYYYDVNPIVVNINASIYSQDGKLIFSGFPHPIYLTDSGDNHVPTIADDGNQLWPLDGKYAKKVDGKTYIPIFGVWYYVPITISGLKYVNVKPVAVYTENGVNFVVVKVETDQELGNELLNFLVSNYKVVKILGNQTFLLAGTDKTLELRVSDRQFKLSVDDMNNTEVRISGLKATITPSNTILNLTVENLDEFLSDNLTLPKTILINGQQVDVYDVEHGKNWVVITVPTTVGLVTNRFVITYLSHFDLGHSLLDPKFKIMDYKLKFVNDGLVKLIVTMNATTWALITADTIRELFPDGLLSVSGDGKTHTLKVMTDIPANLLKLSFSTVVEAMGTSIPVSVSVDNYNTLRVSRIGLNHYTYSNDTVSISMTETFTASDGVADIPTLILLKTKMKPFAFVNGVAVPYEDYYQTGNSLVVTIDVPLELLKKSSRIVIDGIRLRSTYTVKVVDNYVSPGLYVEGIAPLGSLDCSVPYELVPGEKDGSFIVKLNIHEVGKTATCTFGGNTYTISPEYPGIVSITFTDTDRIDDIADNGRGVYSGYDGVMLTLTTTNPPAFGQYSLVVDNETLFTGKLTTITVRLPELGVGKHVVKLYDGDFLVWKSEFTVYPQPITLKMLHYWTLIVIAVVLVVGALLTGVINTEPYVVSVARRMFPNYEFIQHFKRGNWEVVVMYDPMTGTYLYAYFYNRRFQTVATYRA